MDKALNETVACEGYVVDVDAVATAMLARERIRAVASAVLVSRQPVDRLPRCVEQEEPAAFGDAA